MYKRINISYDMFLNLTVSNVLNPSMCCILIEIMLESFTIFHRPGQSTGCLFFLTWWRYGSYRQLLRLQPFCLDLSCQVQRLRQKTYKNDGKSDMTCLTWIPGSPVNSYHDRRWSPVPDAGAFLRTLPLVWRSVKAAVYGACGYATSGMSSSPRSSGSQRSSEDMWDWKSHLSSSESIIIYHLVYEIVWVGLHLVLSHHIIWSYILLTTCATCHGNDRNHRL